jgi:aminoglycoside phosphotransferase (APT) family kinase protein
VPQWDADRDVGAELVRELLAGQFPELDAPSARLLGEGWDNSVWVVEERLAFRFPRREIAIPGVEREIAVLPRLGPLVPVAVPVPTHVGEPSELYPWPFFGARLLSGVEAAEADLPEGGRADLGGELGRFLRVLHDSATLAAVDPERRLPVDFNRRADMPFRVERTRERLRALDTAGLWSDSSADAVLAEAEGLGPSDGVALTHGDLHLRHVLVDGGSLSGVIDWGDVCIADPAIDLVLYWSLLAPAGRDRFLAGYGKVDEESLLRARVLSLFLCAILALYASDVGHAALERECVAGLERTLTD